MRRLAWAAAVFLLAGCFQVPSSPQSGGGDVQPVTFEVLSAEVVPGRCFDGAEAFGEVCHRLEVLFDNTAYRNDRNTGQLTWKAQDDRGRVHDFGDSDADAVAGGETATLQVSFTLDDGPAKLVELRYDHFRGKGKAPIPAY